MKILIILIALCVGMPMSGAEIVVATDEENFGKFFREFCRNTKFQQSRIRFPLKVVVVDEETRSEKLIQQHEWRHTNLQKLIKESPGNKLETHDTAAGEKDVVFRNAQSGEMVHHLFSRTDTHWYLTSIVDESE